MATIKSAKKKARQALKRREINRSRTSRLNTSVKKVEEAIASGNKTEAQAAFVAAQPVMMRSANRNVTSKNAVARKLSRLSKRIKALKV
jgi:small subunit ribosomal protein S20